MSQGIFGIIDFSRRIDNPDRLAVAMGKFLQNEGSGKAEISYVSDNHYVLGMKRICEAPCQQPSIARNDTLQALCLIHGEIHNDLNTLAESLPENVRYEGDLDLSLHLYRRHGPGFARQLNGLFTFAIMDQREHSFILLNDRFGMAHQVYWTTVNGTFCFATHLKTLLAYPGIQREVDSEALNLFLKYSYIPSPRTIFRGIRKLSPGHLLVFKDGLATVKPYWDFGLNGSPYRSPGSRPYLYTTAERIYFEKNRFQWEGGNSSERRP
jgi:asparagine synthase (glutamine-hydrolysing)